MLFCVFVGDDVWRTFNIADHDAHRSFEDCQTPKASPGGEENRQVLGIRRGRFVTVDGDVRVNSPLAGVHMVRDRQCGTSSRRQQSGMAGHVGQRHASVLFA